MVSIQSIRFQHPKYTDGTFVRRDYSVFLTTTNSNGRLLFYTTNWEGSLDVTKDHVFTVRHEVSSIEEFCKRCYRLEYSKEDGFFVYGQMGKEIESIVDGDYTSGRVLLEIIDDSSDTPILRVSPDQL